MLKHLHEREVKKTHTLRISDSELKLMQKKANVYTGGNVSEWVRYAAISHKPQNSEINTKTKRKYKS